MTERNEGTAVTRAIMDSALAAQRQLRKGLLDRLAEFFERRRLERLSEKGRELCRKGEHDIVGWTLLTKTQMLQKQTDRIPMGMKYVYKGHCVRCQFPVLRTLYDYQS